MTKKHIHFVGIGGIGVSGLARHYHARGYQVTGSDNTSSSITQGLSDQGISVYIGEEPSLVNKDTTKVVYTEGIVKNDESHDEALVRNHETRQAQSLGIPLLSYPEGLAEVFNTTKGVAVTGTHGKSTTTSLLGLIIQASELPASVLTGTNLAQFGNTNYYTNGDELFVIEACEHKRHFLNYTPNISIITNIEADHLDYYKDADTYLQAFADFQNQTDEWLILNGRDKNIDTIRDWDKNTLTLYEDGAYTASGPNTMKGGNIPNICMQIPGDHVLFDAHLAFLAGKILGIDETLMVKALESYTGAWRRMETLGKMPGGNLLMSDYGHHPTEIIATLGALKQAHSNKHIFTIFQPHQHSRTIELLKDFKTCFDDTDSLLIPDIYFSRDSKQDAGDMPVEKFVKELQKRYPQTIDGKGLGNTKDLILDHDANNDNILYILLGAGDVDNLRYELIQNKYET